MSHEVETMAYAGQVPWHGLGVKVSNDLSPEDMQKAAGLDWEVKKYTTFCEVGGKRVKAPQKALVRLSDNKVLTTVGPGWNPVQNAEAFDFFTDFVESGGMEMHTAGSLKEGRMVWALAKVSESFEILGGDRVDSYLLFSNPHQYGKSIDIRFTPIRVVCNNTLTFALNSKTTVGYKTGHRTVFNADHVKETLGLVHVKFEKYRELAEFLASKQTKPEDLLQYYSQVFPKTSGRVEVKTREDLSRNAEEAYGLLNTQPGANYAPESWWQAFNSTTYLMDHVQGRSADNRMYSSWFGGNQANKIKAMNLAVEFANAA